jgi:flagellar protein FliL
MADEEEQIHAEEDATQAKKKSPMLIIVLLVCVVAGGGAGAFVAAPMLFGSDASVEAAGEAVGEPPSGRASGREGPPILYAIDNLVLNPKGTNGTRFLMVSAAFELSDGRVADQIRSREPEIRDILIRTFGQRTVEELADLDQREQLREDVRQVLEDRLQRGSIRRVYLPQFVIQ